MKISFRMFFLFWFALLGGFVVPAGCEADVVQSIASMKVVPSRIELGSLDFGGIESTPVHVRLLVSGMPAGARIVEVDCSHAHGVSVQSQLMTTQEVIMDLQVNKKLLCEFEPFGAFIKREIRIETDSSTEPQYVVPIIGWVDVNNTPRDFSQYVFQGAIRWRGGWSTPNVAGAFLAIVIIFFVGFIDWLRQRSPEVHRWENKIGFSVAILAIIIALVLLGMTYSRGAWLAVLLGFGVLAVCLPSVRQLIGIVTVGFVGVLLILPAGVQRIESYATVQNDLSIANRLKLWEGALQIMAEHPLAGVGSGHFESVFEEDYQAFDHTAKTSTAVNDYLTLGSEHGLFVLGVVLGVLLSLIILSMRQSIKTQSVVTSTLAAMLMTILGASTFSTLWIVSEYRGLSVTIMLALVGSVMVTGLRNVGPRKYGIYLLTQFSRWTMVTLVALFLAALASLTLLPTRTSSLLIHIDHGPALSFRVVEPRWRTSQGIVLYLADFNQAGVLSHSTLRPMAALGWKVIPIPESTGPATLHDLIDAIHRYYPGNNLFVAGDAKGGRVAWETATQESPSIVRAGCGIDFLSLDLDSTRNLGGPRQPFLVYQSLYSDGVSSNPAICAQNRTAFRGLPLKVVLSQDTINRFSEGWMRFLMTLNDFFLSENHNTK